MFATYACLKKPLKGDLIHWTTFWITYHIVTTIVHNLIWWVPFVSSLETLFFLSMYSPLFAEMFRKKCLFVAMKGINVHANQLKIKEYVTRIILYHSTSNIVDLGKDYSNIVDLGKD
jgi:hypothetical protein